MKCFGSRSCHKHEKGEKGEKGDRGKQGIQGEEGWMGPKGSKGSKGYNGPKGETGFKGDVGEKGMDGIKGEPGIKGDGVGIYLNFNSYQMDKYNSINPDTQLEGIWEDINGSHTSIRAWSLQPSNINNASGTPLVSPIQLWCSLPPEFDNNKEVNLNIHFLTTNQNKSGANVKFRVNSDSLSKGEFIPKGKPFLSKDESVDINIIEPGGDAKSIKHYITTVSLDNGKTKMNAGNLNYFVVERVIPIGTEYEGDIYVVAMGLSNEI